MPQPRWVMPGIITEIEVGRAMQSAVRQLQPDWLIHPDSVAAHQAPQKR
jgi:hypothetical protein